MICGSCNAEVADMNWHLSNECIGFIPGLIPPSESEKFFAGLNRIIKAVEDGRVRFVAGREKDARGKYVFEEAPNGTYLAIKNYRIVIESEGK